MYSIQSNMFQESFETKNIHILIFYKNLFRALSFEIIDSKEKSKNIYALLFELGY